MLDLSRTYNSFYGISDAVRIITIPADTNTSVGNSLSLACTAAGIPRPSIAWSRGGVPLVSGPYNITEGSFSNETSHHTVSVLHLCDLLVPDSGQYTCTASNSIAEGTAISTAFLVLQVHSKHFILNPETCPLSRNLPIVLVQLFLTSVKRPPPY